MKTVVIMLSGRQGAGKSTIANALLEILGKHSPTYDMKFAGTLYEMHDACRAILMKKGIKMVNPIKDGGLLQYLGTDYGRKNFGDDVWVDAVRGEIENLERKHKDDGTLYCIINDCRFTNEFQAFPGSLKVRLQASEDTRKGRAEMWRENTSHQSETDLDQYEADGKFDLYLNTEELKVQDCVDKILARLLESH